MNARTVMNHIMEAMNVLALLFMVIVPMSIGLFVSWIFGFGGQGTFIVCSLVCAAVWSGAVR